MPAINMSGDEVVPANPSTGATVLMSPFSGPKGSPFDAKMYPPSIYQPTYTDLVAAPTNYSTGGLCTGIGFGCNAEVPGQDSLFNAAVPSSVNAFMDNYVPGTTLPDGTTAADARLTSIGGGRSTANTPAAPTEPNPYNAQPLLNFGNGGSRDGGAGPAFTGFSIKTVTATGTVANGAAIEAGFINRQGVDITAGLSQFGSSTAASAAVA